MNHKIKTTVFKVLSFLPGNMGMHLYHLLQEFSENKNLDVKMNSSEDTYHNFKALCDSLSISIAGKAILEIGSGWLPIMPYLFLYKGKASKIYTYDLNKHYQKKAIAHFNSVFAKKYEVVIPAASSSPFNLPEEVVYFPQQNVINDTLPPVDIVFSRFVLEHVTPHDLEAMHVKFRENLPKGSHIIHFISPSDHRAYSDASLSLQDFLQYSPQEWDSIQTKFDYHNRYRLPQYLDLFKKSGLELISVTYDAVKEGSKQQEQFRKVTLHDDYKSYTEEELTAGNIVVVLKVVS